MNKYKKIKLLNGAWLYYIKNTISNITAVDVNFPSGSRCDGDKAGLAHFVEHMFFTGTNKYSKEQLFKKYYDFIYVNAATWTDKIAFVGKVFNKEFADYIDLVSQMILHSTFNEDAIEKEKDVVKQEIVRSKDDFSRFAYCNLCYQIYRTDNFKYTTLGLEETVDQITREDVLKFVKKYFVANNCIVVVSSPYSASKIKRILNEQLISRLPVNNELGTMPLRNEKCADSTFFHHEVVDIEKTYFNVGFKVDKGVADWQFFTKLDLIIDMMNGTEGISKTMRLEKSLVYSCYFWFFKNRQDSIVVFETNMDKKNLKACEETLAEYITQVRDHGFTEEQFKQAKRAYDHNKASSEPRVNRMIDKLNTYWKDNLLISKRALRKVRNEFTLEEANAMAKELFSNMNICLATYGNANAEHSYTQKEFNKMFK